MFDNEAVLRPQLPSLVELSEVFQCKIQDFKAVTVNLRRVTAEQFFECYCTSRKPLSSGIKRG